MARYLQSAVCHALADPLEDIEVIVVDDGSADATPEVVAAFMSPEGSHFDRRVQYHRQDNQGKSAAINAVLPRVRGEFLTILDADDELIPGSLAVRYEVATKGRWGADMVIGGFQVIDDTGVIGERHSPEISNSRLLRRRYLSSFRTPFHLNACLLHHRVVERVGGFDERLHRCQDVDYALRCLEQSERVRLVDRAVYKYRKNRRTRAQRLRIRWETLWNRVTVYRKAFAGPLAPAAVAVGIAGDLAKLIYNLFGDYEG